MYIKITNTGPVPYSVNQLRQDNPQVSFPQNLPESTLAEYGVYPLTETDPPSCNLMTETVIEVSATYSEEHGRWEQQWQVVNLSVEQIASTENAAKTANRNQASAELRNTDWCENASVRDTAVTPHLINFAEFDTYRLALRVIAINPPVTVGTWPTRPESNWSA